MKRPNFLVPLILLIHFILLINLRFTAWPEMILWPYFLIKGLLPYRDIAMAHNPLLIFDLAIFYKIFGISLFNLKIYTWVLILLTDLLIYWVAKKITKREKVALLSLAFYVLWQPFFEGNGVWFDLVLAPLALLIFYFLWNKEFFWSGIFSGLAVLVKQTAFWFILPIGFTFWFFKKMNYRAVYCAVSSQARQVRFLRLHSSRKLDGFRRYEIKPQSIARLLLGLIIPVSGFLLYLMATGIWQDFYFWAIQFGIGYLPHAPGQFQLPTLKQFLALGVPYAFIIPAIWFLIKKVKIQEKGQILILLVWCFFASLGIFPRWGYLHFQPFLPFLAIISGILISYFRACEKTSFAYINISYKRLYWAAYLVLIILGTIYLQVRFYRLNWQKADRFFEEETLEAAVWLKENTYPGEKIFILNSWDHLYALTNTLPANSPWVPTLPWYMEYPGIQEEIVADLEKEKPKLVVFEPYREKGLGSYRPEKIDKFLRENYLNTKIIAGRFWILEPK